MTSRQTVQKSLIYDALCAMRNHPTADAVYERVSTQHPSISRATVYRVLHQLSEQGKILYIPVPDGADHYDHQLHRHYHVCCTACGRVEDVALPDPGDLTQRVTEDAGYRLTGCTLLFQGLCPDCREAKNAV